MPLTEGNISRSYLHPQVEVFVNRILRPEDIEPEISEQLVWVSTYKPYGNMRYTDIVNYLYRRELVRVVLLLGFEPERWVMNAFEGYHGLVYIRLPFYEQDFTDKFKHLVIDSNALKETYKRAQKEFAGKVLSQLRHSKKLDLLNASLVPVRAVAVNLLSGIGNMAQLRNLSNRIRSEYLNKDEMKELRFCLEKLQADGEVYGNLNQMFNKLDQLTEDIAGGKSLNPEIIIRKTDELMQRFSYINL